MRWEKGTTPGPTPHIRVLREFEECTLHRRRAHLRQVDVARALGRSRDWVRLMELGQVPCTELLEYWRG